MSIPLREFGKTGVQVSALGLGGHHLGGAKDEKTAIEIVHRALDGGITFYDNAWEYYRGKTESRLGMGPQRPARQSLRHDQGLHSRP
jgi:aryl-alcohol dehydrogenase-like predicted oxidoreductase